MSEWARKRLLVWGTTYPEFSKTYYETICTGAIDAETGQLVRIYPLPLRHMKEPLGSYDWIEAGVQRNTADTRPESHKIQYEAATKVGGIGTKTKKDWEERRRWVLGGSNVLPSVESLWEAQDLTGRSLALVSPRAITRLYVRTKPKEDRAHWERQREEAAKQRELFVDVDAKTKDLQFMPVEYRVEFTCHGPGCKGHDMSILDWGTYVLSRRMFSVGGAAHAEKQVLAKLKSTLDPTKRDLHFFLGNTRAHPGSFMVVGLFCPPRVEPERQLSF